MFYKFRDLVIRHVRNNMNLYFFMLLAFITGVSAGAFTVNGLSSSQNDELVNYFQGFLQLLDNQKIDSGELLKIAIIENMRLIVILWILGVTIIGIPFIFIVIGIRGFVTGFSSGFLVKAMGLKGVLFTFFSVIPKELVIIPCIIALGVSGVNFSKSIVRSKSTKNLSKQDLKANFAAYCMVTLLYTGIIFVGILIEAYVTPVFIKMMAPLMKV